MSALSIQPTYPIFTETDGLPLENGYIWIGAANLDPQGNPINVYWDAALTIAAPQPIRTLNGYPSRSGTPGRLYVNSDYSIRVQNSKGSMVYSAPAATERYSDVVVTANAEDVIYDPPFTNAVQTNVEAKLAQTVSVKDFGAVGDGVTDDTAAIQAALNQGGNICIPSGMSCAITSVNATVANTTLEIAAGAKIVSTVATNKAVILSAENCRIVGDGEIDSPAVFDGVNTRPLYAVIWIESDNCEVRNITLNNIPKIGVRFENCTKGRVTGVTFNGNFPLLDFNPLLTVHGAVAYNPPAVSASVADALIVSDCFIDTCIQGVFTGNFDAVDKQLGVQILGNFFSRCYDHGIYCINNDGAIVANNYFYNCYAPIVVDGIGSKIIGNTAYEDGSFAMTRRAQIISARSSTNAIITGNTIYGNGASISCENIVGSDVTGNLIANNTITQTEAADTFSPFCIRVRSTSGQCVGNKIDGNIVRCISTSSSFAAIYISGNATFTATSNEITNNKIEVNSSIPAISEQLADNTLIQRNCIEFTFNAPAPAVLYGIFIRTASNSNVSDNVIRYTTGGTNVTFRGIDIPSGSTGSYLDNQFQLTSASLAGSVEYFNNAATTVLLRNNQYIERSAAPATGTWARGDVVFNTAPTSGGFIGWVCTVAGTPGTWNTFGVISV